MKVIARTSAFAFKGKNEDIRRIAETLGVTNVLEGSVRRAGPRIRVTAQLIYAVDGMHLWSHRYDREMTDVFAIQDEISKAIVAALQLTLLGIGTSATNPRRASNWNLLFALLAFITYYNLLNLSQAWVSAGRFTMGPALLLLHGGAFALAPGMGLNAYFSFTVVQSMHVPWPVALGCVFVSGAIFLILTLAGIRQMIVAAIPSHLFAAVAAGIGLFIGLLHQDT